MINEHDAGKLQWNVLAQDEALESQPGKLWHFSVHVHQVAN